MDEDDPNKEDDEFNRAVLLQARQRVQSEQGYTVTLGGYKYDEEGGMSAKRARLSFPPEKYQNLDEPVSPSYFAELTSPKLTYT